MTSRRKLRHREDAMFERLPTLGPYDLDALRALALRERERATVRRLPIGRGPDWQSRIDAVEAEQRHRAEQATMSAAQEHGDSDASTDHEA